MEKRSPTISIPTPCAENWDAMAPAQQGRHCSACQKVVIDFTQMSDAQILNVFKRVKGQKPCGRYLTTQLDRPLLDSRPKISFAAMIVKKAAAVLLLVQSANTALAQHVKSDTIITEQTDKTTKSDRPLVAVKGTVVNEATGKPAAGVMLYIQEADKNIIADSVGSFTFYILNNIDTVHVTAKDPAQYGGVSTIVLTGNIICTPENKKLELRIPAQNWEVISLLRPDIVQMGVWPGYPTPYVLNLPCTIAAYFVKASKAVFPKLPPLPSSVSSATVWGRLTNYWMGKNIR